MEEPKDHKRLVAMQPSSGGGDNKKVKVEADADDDERKPSAIDKPSEKDTDTQVKQEEHAADTHNDAMEEEEEEEAICPLKQFPKEHQPYVLHRAAGGDVLEIMEEHNAEGVLDIDTEGKSAKFWVKFPDDKGVLGGRIDYVGVIDGRPPTFFKAIASQAYINYGMWHGPIRRDGDMPGANFGGTMMSFGQNFAVAGNEDISVTNPLSIDIIHSLELKKDEPSDDDDGSGYKPMKAGNICFTLFVEDGVSGYGSGRDVPVPVSLWFRPQADSAVKIPANILEDIDKLPPMK